MDIYMLYCEDATHLGGPMGSEYTTPVFSKAFKSLEGAQKYAQEFYKKRTKHSDKIAWDTDDGNLYKDVGCYIFKIVKEELGG